MGRMVGLEPSLRLEDCPERSPAPLYVVSGGTDPSAETLFVERCCTVCWDTLLNLPTDEASAGCRNDCSGTDSVKRSWLIKVEVSNAVTVTVDRSSSTLVDSSTTYSIV